MKKTYTDCIEKRKEITMTLIVYKVKRYKLKGMSLKNHILTVSKKRKERNDHDINSI